MGPSAVIQSLLRRLADDGIHHVAFLGASGDRVLYWE